MPSCHPALRKCVAFTLAEFFSPHCASFRKTAFTLAEVLITLSIIGVVAALTLPSVLSNIEKKRTVTVLKRAYSDLHNYVKDFDYINDCSGSLKNCAGGDEEFMAKFIEYLEKKQNFKKQVKDEKLISFSGEQNVGIGGLIYHGNNAATLISPNGQYLYGIGKNLSDNNYYLNVSPTNHDYFRAAIIIYTNPPKYFRKKARIGYDTFMAFVMQSERIIPNGSKQCGTGVPPYGWTYYCSSWEMKKTCDKTGIQTSAASNPGYGCLGRIIDEGWEINY